MGKPKKNRKRNFDAMNALARKPATFKDRREPRKQSNNWRNHLPE
jgi:hypothetical protein